MYKPKILVVEDDPAITNLIRTTLDTQEYQYHTARNGAGAILDAVSYNPDVIILDLGLPDMDGVEIIRKVRGWSNVPIIIVSARSEDQDNVEALDAGSLPDWDQALDVGNTLRSLRPEDQMILGLFYYDGLSVRDIAKALGISEDSVKQRLHRGRKRFQAAYLEKEELCHEK